jgi:itaconate CoA-transferase
MPLPLAGLLVVSLEQAVAAPMCTCRLADAGARVIKIERPEGDFARYYDKLAISREDGRKRPDGRAEGQSAYFVWLNRGKQSLVLDLARADDKALLAATIAKADVFLQNLKPGAIAKLGFPLEPLRRAHPRLVICSISGYGEEGPYAARKAYDMLVQAESGLASITGGPEAPARVGVSVCDIAAGMNAYEAILEALLAREKTGDGAAISISMFDAMADWMAVPLIQYEGGAPPKRIGLAHTSIAPGAFKTKDGADILISIQSDREWRVLAEKVLGDKALAADPAFATNVERVKRRGETDARVAAVFGATDEAALTQKLAEHDIAFARVNDTGDLAVHPQLSRIEVATPSGAMSYPAPPARSDGPQRRYGAVPSLGEHTAQIWAEFLPHTPRPRE